MSSAVSAEPSCHLTPLRMLNVYFFPPFVAAGISVHRSHTKSVGEDGFSGLTRISTL